ncbi:MAG: hypothetical protein FWG55_06630, partial [Candidatus Bathyarchaeota archaeon]|nr:hypothetical protein [Candidatus Termiticorpusculum sp.]
FDTGLGNTNTTTQIHTASYIVNEKLYCYRPGNHFLMTVNPPGTLPLANLFQHEASHLFGCYDNDPGLTDICIMSYTWIGATRNYCKSGYDCYNVMMTNRYRFD